MRPLFDQAFTRCLRRVRPLALFQPLASAAPAVNLADIDVEKVKDTREGMIHHFIDRLRQSVKSRNRRIDDCAGFGHARHVANMADRSEEHTSELQSLRHLVCRLLLEKKKKNK